jgi:formate dehydrogenase iron-sulfur subunit
MTVTIFVPRDAAALALGAEKVAKAIAQEIAARGLDAKVVRNGSRGMFWLEPLVEVSTPQGRVAYGPVAEEDVPALFDAGLVAYGPVKAADVASLFDAGFLTGSDHPLCLGLTKEIPFLRQQTRLTFSRCGVTDPLSLDDYRHYQGLKGLEKAISLTPTEIVKEVTDSGLRGRGGAGFPTGIKWTTALRVPTE